MKKNEKIDQNCNAKMPAKIDAKISTLSIKPILVPRELIYGKYCNDNRRVSVYCYLYCNRTYVDEVINYNINYLLKWLKIRPDRNKGKTNDIYADTLKRLYINGYFESDNDDFNLSKKDILLKMNPNRFRPSNFGIIYSNELDMILNYKEYINDKSLIVRTSSSILLLLLSYIRSNLRINKYDTVDKLPECCFRYYITIANNLGITERMVSKHIKILNLLGIIEYKEVPRYQDSNGMWHTGLKVFANKYRYIKENNGYVIDVFYSGKAEIKRQIKIIMESINSKKTVT